VVTSAGLVHSTGMSGPVTIADLKRDGKLLEIGCLACSRHLYVDPASVGLPDHQPVPSAAARLRCSVCGATNRRATGQAHGGLWHPIWARPDARVPGVTGKRY
jgi:hypothetical protein